MWKREKIKYVFTLCQESDCDISKDCFWFILGPCSFYEWSKCELIIINCLITQTHSHVSKRLNGEQQGLARLFRLNYFIILSYLTHQMTHWIKNPLNQTKQVMHCWVVCSATTWSSLWGTGSLLCKSDRHMVHPPTVCSLSPHRRPGGTRAHGLISSFHLLLTHSLKRHNDRQRGFRGAGSDCLPFRISYRTVRRDPKDLIMLCGETIKGQFASEPAPYLSRVNRQRPCLNARRVFSLNATIGSLWGLTEVQPVATSERW